MYTTDKEGDSQTLRNDENFKFILKDAVKDNRDIIRIYLNTNDLNFKPSFRPEIFEDIYKDLLPTSGPTSGSGDSNHGTGPVTQPPSKNIPQNVVTDIEETFKTIRKHTTKQPITGSIGSDTTTLIILNHVVLPNDVKDRYSDKGNPRNLMNGDTMKPFDTIIPDP